MSTRPSAAPALWSRVWLGVGVAAFAGLCVYVLTRTKPPFFDELPYFAQAHALCTAGSFRGWLLANDTGPAGPVHALMHYAFSGGAGVAPVPWCRLPNLVLLAAVLALIALHLRTRRTVFPWAVALTGMAMPMVWVMAGMALTEMPAMAGMAAAVYAAGRLGDRDFPGSCGRWALTALIAAGVALALCGGQTYLLTVPAIPLLAWANRRGFGHATAGVLLGLLPALWLFAVWGGLVPPKMGIVEHGLKPEHGLVAACYAGLTALLIAPGFFMAHWRRSLPAALVGVAVNAVTHMVHFTTMTSVQGMLGNPALARAVEWTAGQAIVGVGCAFVVTIMLELWSRRDVWFAAHVFAVLVLCAACVFITHQFSSRYVGMGLPFLVPMLGGWVSFTPWAVMRWTAAMAVGAASLVSYYALA